MIKKIKNNNLIILYALLFICIYFMIIGICILDDFYNDYRCSTTNDVEWFKNHNCIRYVK